MRPRTRCSKSEEVQLNPLHPFASDPKPKHWSAIRYPLRPFPHPPPQFHRCPQDGQPLTALPPLCTRSSYLRGRRLPLLPGPQGHGHATGVIPAAARRGTRSWRRRDRNTLPTPQRHGPALAAAPGPPPTRSVAQAPWRRTAPPRAPLSAPPASAAAGPSRE